MGRSMTLIILHVRSREDDRFSTICAVLMIRMDVDLALETFHVLCHSTGHLDSY